jgi:hypothetical protein
MQLLVVSLIFFISFSVTTILIVNFAYKEFKKNEDSQDNNSNYNTMNKNKNRNNFVDQEDFNENYVSTDSEHQNIDKINSVGFLKKIKGYFAKIFNPTDTNRYYEKTFEDSIHEINQEVIYQDNFDQELPNEYSTLKTKKIGIKNKFFNLFNGSNKKNEDSNSNLEDVGIQDDKNYKLMNIELDTYDGMKFEYVEGELIKAFSISNPPENFLYAIELGNLYGTVELEKQQKEMYLWVLRNGDPDSRNIASQKLIGM